VRIVYARKEILCGVNSLRLGTPWEFGLAAFASLGNFDVFFLMERLGQFVTRLSGILLDLVMF